MPVFQGKGRDDGGEGKPLLPMQERAAAAGKRDKSVLENRSDSESHGRRDSDSSTPAKRGSTSSDAVQRIGDNDDRRSEASSQYEKLPYPKCVFFILCTEACERFSFYGMRAILSLYLKHLFIKDGMEDDKAEDTATVLYHTFNFLCYFTSLIGAFLADSFLGKFRTIFYISIVYVIGQATLSFGAVPGENIGWDNFPQQGISYIGLLLIAFGTGGIKPCVVAFGADQFILPQQKSEMSTFFGIFYASINFGSMISTILTPIFRKQECLGEDECYTLAFGVPAALMFVAVIFFVLGRPWYKLSVPDRNIVLDFCKAMWDAIKAKRKSSEKRSHWMDYAAEKWGKTFVSDIKAVLSVCILFCTYPFFWALYDQQGSRWTFQATRMNGKIGGFYLLPDQMQVVNAALILIYIPIFDKGVYPLFNKFGMLKTPLQKIISGGTLVGVAFIVSAIVELQLEDTYPVPPGADEARLNFHNGLPLDNSDCSVTVTFVDDYSVSQGLSALPGGAIPPGESARVTNEDDDPLMPYGVEEDVGRTVEILADAGICPGLDVPTLDLKIDLESENGTNVWFYEDKRSLRAYISKYTDEVDTSETGYPWVRPIYFLPGITKDAVIRLSTDEYSYDDEDNDGEVAAELEVTDTIPLNDLAGYEADKMGEMRVCVENYKGINELCGVDSAGATVYKELEFGGSYDLYISLVETGDATNPYTLRVDWEVVADPNSIHMLWLLPQYMILTAGEVLFSITSLAFSFTQAPDTMKSVLQALYLMTTAIGNLIDIIVISAVSDLFSSQAWEFFLFAGLMFLDMFVLMLLARRYKYVDYTSGKPRADSDASLRKEDLAEEMRDEMARRESLSLSMSR